MHLFPQIVALQFQIPPECLVFFKSSGIRNGDRSRTGHRAQPVVAVVIGGRASKYRQNTQWLTAKHQRVPRETGQTLRLSPGGIANPASIRREIRDPNGFSRCADMLDFQIAR